MKKVILLLTAVFAFVIADAQTEDPGLIFRDLTYEEALNEAGKQDKMVFMHGYADWCHYCHDMVEKVYPDTAVGAFFNSNFICIKVNLEKEGAELNKRLLSHTFPTLIFFDSKGTVIHRAAGRHLKPLLLNLAKAAMDPRQQLYSWEKVFNNGNCSADTAYRYLRKMEVAAMNFQPEAIKYLSPLTDTDLKAEKNWKIINDLYKDVTAPFMNRLITMKPELEKLYTKQVVNAKFFDMYKYDLGIKIRTLDSLGYDKVRLQLKDGKLDIGEMIADYAEMMKAKMKGEYALYFKLSEPFAKKYAMNNPVMLNEIAQVYYERTKDPQHLNKAVEWAKESVKQSDTYTNNETLAGILILLGKKAEAKEVANHAIEVGTKNKNNVQKARIFLEKIEELPDDNIK